MFFLKKFFGLKDTQKERRMRRYSYLFIAVFFFCAMAAPAFAQIATSDSNADATAGAVAIGGGNSSSDAVGIGIGEGGSASAGASATGGNSQSQSSINMGDTESTSSLNLTQTYEATKIPRNFPEVQQAQRPTFFSGNHSGPYEKDWNASSVPWFYKTRWTEKDISRMKKGNDLDGEMRVYMYQEPFKGKSESFKVVTENTTPEKIQSEYTVIAKIIVHSDDEKGVDYDSLFIMAGKENLKKIGAPILLVETVGYTFGSSVSGWNIGLGGGVSMVGDGPGVGGSVGGGPGYGKVRSSAVTHPFITFLAVAPKGYIPPDPPKKKEDTDW